MIVVSGHIRVRPDKMDELRPSMRAALEGTRKEKGCLLYAYGVDVLDPGLIRIVERWESWEAIAAHAKAPHIKAWADARESAGGTLDRDIRAYEVTGSPREL
jgi:quinol monooxygenase YgiN